MSDDTTPALAAIPWYKTAVIRGILIAVFTQIIARIAAKFHMDVAALAAIGLDANALTEIALDGISTAAAAYALHGRVVKPLPSVTLNQKQADAINAAAKPVDAQSTLGESNAKNSTAPTPPPAG